MTVKPFSWKTVMSYRREIFGILAAWIVFYHVNRYNGIGHDNIIKTIASLCLQKGRCGVDLFLFLSAIGLSFSISKNDLKTFYTNRIKKIIPAYLICAIPYFIWYDFFYTQDGILNFLLNVTTINYWIVGNEFQLWFVSFILVAYLVYPLLYQADEKTYHISTIAIMIVFIAFEWFLYLNGNPMFEKYELFLSRVPVFLLGILMFKTIKDNREIKIPQICLIVLIIFATYYFSMKTETLILKRYSEGIFCIGLMIIYAFIRNFGILKILGSVFDFLGKISLEIYMVHVLIFFELLNYYVSWNALPSIAWYVIVPLVSISLSKLISLLANKIVLCIEKRTNKPA